MKFIKVLCFIAVLINIDIYGNRHNKKIVNSRFISEIVNSPFKTLEIKHEKAKKTIKKYFNNIKYKVIAIYPYGYEETKVYFAVEEYMPKKYYNAVKRGIIVKENGEIVAYLDINKGIYNKKNKIIDFISIGFKKGEVKCFILSNPKNNSKNIDYSFIILDKNDYNMSSPAWGYPASMGFATFSLSKQRSRNDVIIYIEDFSATEKEILGLQRRKLKGYRDALAKGRAVKSAAVKKEFARLLKLGLVEGANLIKKKSEVNKEPLKTSNTNETNNKSRNTLIYILIAGLAIIIIIVLAKVIKKKELKTT